MLGAVIAQITVSNWHNTNCLKTFRDHQSEVNSFIRRLNCRTGFIRVIVIRNGYFLNAVSGFAVEAYAGSHFSKFSHSHLGGFFRSIDGVIAFCLNRYDPNTLKFGDMNIWGPLLRKPESITIEVLVTCWLKDRCHESLPPRYHVLKIVGSALLLQLTPLRLCQC